MEIGYPIPNTWINTQVLLHYSSIKISVSLQFKPVLLFSILDFPNTIREEIMINGETNLKWWVIIIVWLTHIFGSLGSLILINVQSCVVKVKYVIWYLTISTDLTIIFWFDCYCLIRLLMPDSHHSDFSGRNWREIRTAHITMISRRFLADFLPRK